MGSLSQLAAKIEGRAPAPVDDDLDPALARRNAATADAIRAAGVPDELNLFLPQNLNRGRPTMKTAVGPKEAQVRGLRSGLVDSSTLKKTGSFNARVNLDAQAKIDAAKKPASVDDAFEKIAAENRAAEALMPAYDAATAATEAVFLFRWSKGKPIKRQSSDATFWGTGRWMTKLASAQVQSLADFGYGTLSGDPTKGGSTLTMFDPKKAALTPAAKMIPSTEPTATAAAKPPKEPTVNTKTTAAKKTPTAKKTTKPATTARRATTKAASTAARAPKKESKSDIVDRMLKTPKGATKADLSKATGWPHVNLKVAAERAEGFKLVEEGDRFRLVKK